MISDDNFNEFNFYLNGIVTEKSLLDNYSKNIISYKQNIKNIKWEDLIIESHDNHTTSETKYNIKLPIGINENLIDKIEELKSKIPNLKRIFDDEVFKSDEINFKCTLSISMNRNRIDISNLPEAFKKLGLGLKIYRAILQNVNFISSENRELSPYGKLIWNKMRTSDMFFTFYTRKLGFSFPSNYSPSDIIQTLYSQIKSINPDEILWDENFFNDNLNLIISSPLNKYVK
jgi:hypothetical protein